MMDNNLTVFRKTCDCLIFAIVACLCVYLWNIFFASSSVPATIVPTQNVSTAQKVTLYAEETWYDGTVDTINVVTLVPPEWITLHDAQLGAMVPIPLDVQEMGLDENLLAKILAIERCPEIRAGPGRVVLTTVNHLSRGVCNLTYINSAGQSETIRPTLSHRFYSLDRKDWIHIGDANTGEKLQGFGNDIITVVSCQPLGKTERVYNMTVEDEHVYHVGYLNLLAHNTGCLDYRPDLKGWKSHAGLVYGPDTTKSPFRNRIEHVFDHTGPSSIPGKSPHTIFSVEKKELLPLIDDAWLRTGQGVNMGIPQGKYTVYEIPMGRVIGTNNETTIRLVVKSNSSEVVTAYPIP
jgi:hypothetical protein